MTPIQQRLAAARLRIEAAKIKPATTRAILASAPILEAWTPYKASPWQRITYLLGGREMN